MERTGAQIVWETLTRLGVEVVFGYPGGAIMPVYDAMLGYRIHHVLVRHEQGAAHMADGYARASGKVGVALATSGPGATNLVTGIATAMLDSSPVVFITGQVPSHLLGSDAFQETDITGVTLPITKHNFLVTNAEDIAPTIREAFAIARSGRPGPVLVDITKDAQQARADLRRRRGRAGGAARADADAADRARARAGAAQRGRAAGHLVRAGRHLRPARRPSCARSPRRRTSRWRRRCSGWARFPASHPLALGMMGMHGQAWVNHAIQEADLIDRARHALRRSRDRRSQEVRAQRPQDPLRDRRRRDQQERPRRRGHRRRRQADAGGAGRRRLAAAPGRLARARRPLAHRRARVRSQGLAARRAAARRPRSSTRCGS